MKTPPSFLVQPSLVKRLLAVLCGVAVFAGTAGYFVYYTGRNEGYAPAQPIPFSHKLHAGDMQIACQYCHADADKSRHASVPAMNVCMNCHTVAGLDKPEIQKLNAIAKQGKAVEWVRVHDLPDFVYFSHQWHIAKGFSCQQCHGPVESMDTVRQVAPLTMKWCVECHRENGAPTDCSTCHN